MFASLFGFPRAARSGPRQSNVEGNTAFALDLFGEIKSRPGNLFFSPYSISTCLAMTYAGAGGDTEKQMSRVLHLDESQNRVHGSFGSLQQQLNQAGNQKGIELSVANCLWAQKNHPFLKSFLETVTNSYQANVNQADFKTQAEMVRGEINKWIAQQTKDKIQNILSPGSLNEVTRLVLANAIYFKGLWAKPYEKSQTSTQPFHITATRQSDVPLMHHFDEVRYIEDKDLQAVELPYQGGELSMVVLLPRRIDACLDLENQLTPAFLSRLVSQMRRRTVEIFLPKFRLESNFDLNGPLAKMGMPDAFGAKADFSGMDGTRRLFISGIFHQAWGEVNEEGTEAAAATVGAAVASGIIEKPQPPPVFRADHPFVFLIRHLRSGSILFLGRLADPTQ